MSMSRFGIAAVAALAVTGSALSVATPASARDGGAIAAGVIGGLAAGALVGSAASGAYAAPAYGYAPAYAPPPPPAYGGCYFTRQATYDPYGNFAGYRRVQVCQ